MSAATHTVRATAAAIAFLLSASAMPAQQDPRESPMVPGRSDQDTVRMLGEKRVRVRFERAALAEWTKALAVEIGIPVFFSPRANQVDAARTNLSDLSLPELPAKSALDVIGTVTGLSWRVFRGVVLFDTPTPSVQLFGQVLRAGPVALRPDDTVLALLARVEWTENADLEHVMMIRPHPVRPLMLTIDLRRMVLSGKTSTNVTVQDGDMLIVPAVPGPQDLPTADTSADPTPVPAAQRQEKWITVGQKVVFFVTPQTLLDPALEQLAWLTKPQVVNHEGRILVPYIGRVPVAGLTQQQLEDLVKKQLYETLTVTIPMRARVFVR